jgi:hypothetical protein
MDKVLQQDSSKCITPSSERFGIDLSEFSSNLGTVSLEREKETAGGQALPEKLKSEVRCRLPRQHFAVFLSP